MDKVLQQAVAPDQLLTWLVIAFLVGYFVYKEWPEFKKRVAGTAVKEVKDSAAEKSVNDRLAVIEDDIRKIKEKLDVDYERLNSMSKWRKSMEQRVAESLEERKILMDAMLGILGGLQQLGANGPTEEASDRIHKYLNQQAHRREANDE